MFQVLFVDDEPSSLLITQSLIDWAKFELNITKTVSNGAEALEYLKSHMVHAVVTDLQMPVMDGVTLILRLRELGFTGPILALSNYTDFNLVRGALIAGAYDYLLKIDTTKEQLEKAITQMVGILNKKNTVVLDTPNNRAITNPATDKFNRALLDEDFDLAGITLPKSLEFPLIACHILVQSTKDLHSALMGFLPTSFDSIFQHHQQPYCFHVSNNEFIILLSQKNLSKDIILKKMSALSRQLNTFISVPSYISYTSDLDTISSIRDFIALSDHGKTTIFYESSTRVLKIPTADTFTEFHDQWELLSSSVLSSLRAHDIPAVIAVLNEFIGFSSQAAIAPSRIKNAFVILLWCCRELSLIQASVAELHNVADKIELTSTVFSLYEIVTSVFHDYTTAKDTTATGFIHPEVAKALLFIHKYYSVKISLDDVAKHIGLSKEYASRLFLKETGVNMFRYILSVRMNKAVEIMVADDNALIKDVATAVGFENQYFFSTKFKEFYGVSPNVYRAQRKAYNSTKDC